MEIQGIIIKVLPEVSGISKAGKEWKKREYVLETQDQFPRKVHFDFFGERADMYPLNIGDNIVLSFDIESREYNDRWFTSIRGWKAEKASGVAAPVPPTQFVQQAPPTPQSPIADIPPTPVQDSVDDLPF